MTQSSRQQVTASELVRNFGVWQECAARAPVYILHRGRPRLVLTSVDLMDALCAPHSQHPVGGRSAGERVALETVRHPAIVVDRQARVVHANAAALARYGDCLTTGADVTSVARAADAFLAQAITRVLTSGVEESVEFVPANLPDRRISCLVRPFPGGTLLTFEDVSLADEWRKARALMLAQEAAMTVTGVAAFAQVGLRGQIEAAGDGLAGLVGATIEALTGARLTGLFEVGSRAAVGEAIETVLTDGTPHALDARILVRGANAVEVRVGFAPMGAAPRRSGVVATIIRYETS